MKLTPIQSAMLKGARIERYAILKRIERMMKEDADGEGIVTWIRNRHKRYSRRKGGLAP